MATITKRQVRFSLVWDKSNPANLTWRVDVRAVVADDSENGGEKWITVSTPDDTTITRADFYTKDGTDIETLMINKSTEVLQALGSGQGTHTIVDDLD
jgi:hypothetical protein